MVQYLVTGGAGFIGSHIVEALLAKGDQVRVLDNFASGHLNNLADIESQIEIVEGDIRDRDAVRAAMDGVEIVFHLAAIVSVQRSMEDPQETEAINAGGTLNVLTAAQEASIRRVIFSSTSAVYGDDLTLPKQEEMPPKPKSPYAVAKLAAEGYCQIYNYSFGLETVTLRYFNVYGPRQDPSSPYSGVISIFVDRMLQGRAPTIFGNGEQTRDFVYVSDVVRANLLAAERREIAGSTFNIGRGQQVSVNRLFRQLNELLPTEVEVIYALARSGEIEHSYADVTRVDQVLGWQASVSLETGLHRCLQFYSTADKLLLAMENV